MEQCDKESLNEGLEPEGISNFSSEFSYLYKNSGKCTNLSQQERRELLLKEQKEKRHSLVDSHRNFSDLLLEDENGDHAETEENMETDIQNDRPTIVKQFQFMKSEWLCEVPDDLEDNWLVKCAPQGFRVLLIAKHNRTDVYNERKKILTLRTHLPGGGCDKFSGLTVLDCIFNRLTKTFFVLDCLFWNTMSMLDSETTFRFYWLKNKFDENYKLSETNKPHRIYLLDFIPAQKTLIQDKIFQVLNVGNHQVLQEGVVFYHKETHYTFGETPLLGWLHAYMLPEKLGINVLQENITKMPEDYVCLEKYLESLKHKKSKRKKGEIRVEKPQMDTS